MTNRQCSILPGRFHPSTFDLWMLNYCVRYGNRWNHSGIITGYSVEFTYLYVPSKLYRRKVGYKHFILWQLPHYGGQCQPIIFALQARFLGHLALHKRFARKLACGSLFIAYDLLPNRLRSWTSQYKISPRHISTGPLHMLPRFYSQPICLVFFKVSY